MSRSAAIQKRGRTCSGQAWLILSFLVAVVLFGSGCSYFRPGMTEAGRLAEWREAREELAPREGSFDLGLPRMWAWP